MTRSLFRESGRALQTARAGLNGLGESGWFLDTGSDPGAAPAEPLGSFLPNDPGAAAASSSGGAAWDAFGQLVSAGANIYGQIQQQQAASDAAAAQAQTVQAQIQAALAAQAGAAQQAQAAAASRAAQSGGWTVSSEAAIALGVGAVLLALIATT